jgi:hypothetical protein
MQRSIKKKNGDDDEVINTYALFSGPDRLRKKILKHSFISFAPFAHAALLRERVVRCIFRITSSWLVGIPVLLALRVVLSGSDKMREVESM